MGLSLDDFAAASTPRRSPCSVTLLLAQLDERDAEVLQEALDAPVETITHAAIAKVLAANGHPIRQGTIARHRNKQCRCDR